MVYLLNKILYLRTEQVVMVVTLLGALINDEKKFVKLNI